MFVCESCVQFVLARILTRRRTVQSDADMSFLLECDLPPSGGTLESGSHAGNFDPGVSLRRDKFLSVRKTSPLCQRFVLSPIKQGWREL